MIWTGGWSWVECDSGDNAAGVSDLNEVTDGVGEKAATETAACTVCAL